MRVFDHLDPAAREAYEAAVEARTVEMARLRRGGMTWKEIGRRYGFSHTHVIRLVAHRRDLLGDVAGRRILPARTPAGPFASGRNSGTFSRPTDPKEESSS